MQVLLLFFFFFCSISGDYGLFSFISCVCLCKRTVYFYNLSMEPCLSSPQIHLPKTNDGEGKSGEPSAVHVKKCKEIISTLPRKKGWKGSSDYLHQYQGFWYYDSFLEGIMSAQDHFQARSQDIIVASCPKTGTTWLKALTFAIATRTSFDDSTCTSPLLTKAPHECVPFLEIDLANDSSNRNMELNLVATHIPYVSLPHSILASGCKIVYIWRDPKDVFVSMWYFVAKQMISKDSEPISLEEAFELFCQGIVNYGPYWDHVLGFWRARVEFPEKIMFVKYEEMMKDTCFYVKKLAEFMGYPFTSEEEERGMVENVINMCKFEKLSNLEVNKNGMHRPNTSLEIENNLYFRKGKVGDWENELTAEMGARLDWIVEQKLSGSGLKLM